MRVYLIIATVTIISIIPYCTASTDTVLLDSPSDPILVTSYTLGSWSEDDIENV